MRSALCILGIFCFSAICATCDAVPAKVTGGTTFVGFDPAVLESLGLATDAEPIVPSPDVDTTSMEGFFGFSINDRSNGTTAAYDTDDFPASYTGVFAHSGSLAFPAVDAEVGDFIIAFDSARATADLSGFFVASGLDNDLMGAPLFDVPNAGLSVEPPPDQFNVDASLVISAELAAALDAPQVAGLGIGSVVQMATAVPEPSTLIASLVVFIAVGLIVWRRRD